MKEVTIHLGTHKTGSTSIQQALEGYSDDTTRYASFSDINHSIPIYTIFSKNRYAYHIWVNAGLHKPQIDKKIEQFQKTLDDDLTDMSYERLIISGEDIGMLDPQELHQFIALLKEKNLNIKVVMYTRNPHTLVASDVQEQIKGGSYRPIQYNLRIKNRVLPFLQSLPSENLIIRDFDSEIKEHGSIVSSFASLLNLNTLKDSRSNEAISIQALSLIYKLNTIPLQLIGRPDRYKIRSAIMEKITSTFGISDGYEKPEPKKFSCLFTPNATNECTFLRENFGINYEVKTSEPKPMQLLKYFDESLIGHEAEIKQLFDQLGTPFTPSVKLEYNFLEAVVSAIERKSNTFFDFQPDKYLKLNKDVERSGINPYEHFFRFGLSKGRKYK